MQVQSVVSGVNPLCDSSDAAFDGNSSGVSWGAVLAGAADDARKDAIEREFDEIFTQKTCFESLNLALKRIHRNKKELLLVLDRPEIPLHNNLSEHDIREYVKKRKISASTRSDTGRKCRDTFTSLKKTCRKLGISFWDYLKDRVANINAIPPLPDLIRSSSSV